MSVAIVPTTSPAAQEARKWAETGFDTWTSVQVIDIAEKIEIDEESGADFRVALMDEIFPVRDLLKSLPEPKSMSDALAHIMLEMAIGDWMDQGADSLDIQRAAKTYWRNFI